MCRIAGVVGMNAVSRTTGMEPAASVKAMTGCMAQGGPDDEGFYANDSATVHFGHRRLSLLDLSPAGHQPMTTADGTLIVTFNGEIYNYAELRTELTAKGHRFRTGTDTEVILHAFREWGEASFPKFNGMFAFGLHDTLTQHVYLVRDPSGIKPLYYSVQDRNLLFASEVKAFLRSGHAFEEHPDWKIFLLSLGFIPDPFTTLHDVRSLPKGTYLKWNLSRSSFEIQPYYQYAYSRLITDSAAAISLVRERLEAAVARHLISDAPIGVFLSGGIDSSLLALLAGQRMGPNVHTLSVVFNEEAFSERKHQQTIVDKLHGRHTYYNITADDFNESLPDIIAAMDQPSIDGINTYFISKCARKEGLKAVLSGLGADELLGGYPSFKRSAAFAYTQYLPGFAYQLGRYLPSDKLRKTSYLSLPGDIGKYLFLRGIFNPDTVAGILDTTTAHVLDALERLTFTDRYSELGTGNFASWLETNFYMQNLLLKDSDAMGMWHGVEIRVPFLDKEFMEAVLQIHPKLKFGPSQTKWLLIEAFRDVLPRSIWDRPKQGFTFPFQQWMKHQPLTAGLDGSPNPTVSRLAQAFQTDTLHWSRLWAVALSRAGTPAPSVTRPKIAVH